VGVWVETNIINNTPNFTCGGCHGI
jgi:hypothetical protein